MVQKGLAFAEPQVGPGMIQEESAGLGGPSWGSSVITTDVGLPLQMAQAWLPALLSGSQIQKAALSQQGWLAAQQQGHSVPCQADEARPDPFWLHYPTCLLDICCSLKIIGLVCDSVLEAWLF